MLFPHICAFHAQKDNVIILPADPKIKKNRPILDTFQPFLTITAQMPSSKSTVVILFPAGFSRLKVVFEHILCEWAKDSNQDKTSTYETHEGNLTPPLTLKTEQQAQEPT